MSQLSENVLTLLEEHRGNHVSGEKIAKQLSVSRAAVWKAIDLLRKEGHAIDASNNRGYCLRHESDLLTAGGIYAALDPIWRKIPITIYPIIDSTNRAAKMAASDGAEALFLPRSKQMAAVAEGEHSTLRQKRGSI